jgi:citrate lyase subunit beta/citryl-CoA lyase
VALIESGQGLGNLESVAAAGIARFAFGSIHSQLDLGIVGQREELFLARSSIVLVSRLAGLPPPVDGVTIAFDGPARLTNEVGYARRLVFVQALHPSAPVEAVNAGFLPPCDEIDWAQPMLDAAAQGGGHAVRLEAR